MFRMTLKTENLLFRNTITYSMEQSPSWEEDRFSASQEIPRILRNRKVLYRIYKSPRPVPFLSQINPVSAPVPLPEDPT